MINWSELKLKFMEECTDYKNSTINPLLTKSTEDIFDWFKSQLDSGKQLKIKTKTGITYRINVKELKIEEAYQECEWMIGREFSDINKWFGMKESEVIEI